MTDEKIFIVKNPSQDNEHFNLGVFAWCNVVELTKDEINLLKGLLRVEVDKMENERGCKAGRSIIERDKDLLKKLEMIK